MLHFDANPITIGGATAEYSTHAGLDISLTSKSMMQLIPFCKSIIMCEAVALNWISGYRVMKDLTILKTI